MTLMEQPVIVTDHKGIKREATALSVDFERGSVFVRFKAPFEHTTANIAVDRVELVE